MIKFGDVMMIENPIKGASAMEFRERFGFSLKPH